MAALVCTPAETLASSGTAVTTPWPLVVTRFVWVLSPCAASGRATPANATAAARLPAARRRITSRLMPFLRRRPGFLSHVRYRFVDCRWSMTDAEEGRRDYLESHIPGAVFVDVERELSAPPGALGRHPLPTAADFAEAMSRAGIETGVFVVAYGSLGGAERLWWLLRHFGHDDCAVLDLAAWHGPLRGGAETVERTTFEARPRDGRHDRAGGACRAPGCAGRRRRTRPERWRGEPNAVDRVPGRVPGALNAPWNEPLPVAPGRRGRRVLRLRGDGDGRPAPPAPRRPGRLALSRLVVGVGAAPRAPGRARD